MPEELPNLDLVVKLMGMSTSSNDGEALVALRKANEQIKKYGWTWDTLLRGKVKVNIIQDPFANVSAPPIREKERASFNNNTPPPPRPQPQPRPSPPPPPPPPPKAPLRVIFRKDALGIWVLMSNQPLKKGDFVLVSKKNGATDQQQVGDFIKDGFDNGDLVYYYKIFQKPWQPPAAPAGANKWQKKNPKIGVNDLFD